MAARSARRRFAKRRGGGVTHDARVLTAWRARSDRVRSLHGRAPLRSLGLRTSSSKTKRRLLAGAASSINGGRVAASVSRISAAQIPGATLLVRELHRHPLDKAAPPIG